MIAAACSSNSGSSPTTTQSSAAASPTATIPAAPSSGTLTETGSSALFPLVSEWQKAYEAANPGIKISSASTNSGTGITDVAQGLVNLGASDSYMSASQTSQYPSLLNIPLGVDAIAVYYNLPGVTSLNLSGTVLAKIYTGKITTWNDPAIAALNSGVTLPAEKIVPVHRGDSGGSTVLFTQYLNAQDPGDWPANDISSAPTWPSVAGSLAETGSGAMVTAGGQTAGSIIYDAVSYQSQATAAKLTQAALLNGAGKYVTATPASLTASAASFPALPANGTEDLINTKAATGFPITGYEYGIVNKSQTDAAEVPLLQNFLYWTITTGSSNTYLGPVGFVPLPAASQAVAKSLILQISNG